MSAPNVYVIDDDASVRDGLSSLFRSVGYATHCFSSVSDFVVYKRADHPACLVLDVRMPDKNGLDFQRDLNSRDDPIPIVFLTGHGDVPMSVRAIKEGAIEFLLKPFREQELLDAVQCGLFRDAERRKHVAAASDVIACYLTLSERERFVLRLAATGHGNKEIGYRFGLREITIKIERAKAMKKMKAKSIVELIQKLAVIDAIDIGSVT